MKKMLKGGRMPLWLQAFLWGLVIGSGLLLGAAIAYFSPLSHRTIAAVMGFGSGVLISALSFGLMEEAFVHGGFAATITGFLAGGGLFSAANWYLSRRGAKHRKRCGECVRQPSEREIGGSGVSIALGASIDAIPEAIVIGLALLGGVTVAKTVFAGFFLANIPQGLSSASGMKETGRPGAYVLGVWTAITLSSGLAALLGYAVFGNFSPKVIASITAIAAGGALAMLAETMIPEAFEEAQHFIGLITVAGFICFFVLTRI